MKIFIAVFICKILYFIGKRVGKGSSLPGKLVLKLFPDVLERLSLPDIVIAVTGSNGKTTTTEMIAHVLKENGSSVGWNHEGSNQTEGIATLLLRIASFSGKVKRDAIVMECDERYAKNIFSKVRPSIILVTNLCRDQLTRNGHPEFIEDCLRAAIAAAGDGVKLVLNADDPYVSTLALSHDKKNTSDFSGVNVIHAVLWFGVNPASCATYRCGMYDDGAFCPVCKARMTYSHRIIGHYGSYDCSVCGLKRNTPDVEVTIRGTQKDGSLVFGESVAHGDGSFVTNETEMHVRLPSLMNAYNFCSAVAVAKAAGISIPDSVKALDRYKLTSGRTTHLTLGDRKGLLLIAKHENTFAYDASLSWIIEQKKPCTVIVLVDAISRKYITGEVSWFWDIDFGLLTDENVKNVVLAGRYANELAMRFAISEVEKSKIELVVDLSGLREYIEKNTTGEIYAVTCFSDKVKLLGALE